MNIIRLQGDIEKRKGIYYEYDADATPLGEGGMGRVFKGFRIVERTGEQTPVAIKAIYENIPERVVERARREAGIQLDNDNLIKMYGFVETVSPSSDNSQVKIHYHVIMELLIGVTLEDILNGITNDHNGMQIPFAAEIYNQYKSNKEAAVVRIMKSILSGLMALHDRGYIHRDIDPSNIMITIDGKIKLIDFGICKQIVSLESLDKALTATGVFMGKVNYAAPELVLGDVKSQNYTTDIYALGVLLYQLCTGHLPFSGTDQDILSANLRKALPMKDVHGVDFKRIIRKATDKVQSKRYATVAELRVDLERISTNKSTISRTGIKIGVISVLVIMFVICIFIIFTRKSSKNETYTTDRSITFQTAKELYDIAIHKLNCKDSIQLQIIGKKELKILAEDSLYMPARIKYNVLLINSQDQKEVQAGYAELQKILQEDNLNHTALFECGLTLSKGNRFFSVPTTRQSFLNINPDLERANQLLYRAIELDSTDYKSVYWSFNNLIEKKLDGSLSQDGDKQITQLYNLFKKRSKNFSDETSEKYKSAIESDGETLKAWGLIK